MTTESNQKHRAIAKVIVFGFAAIFGLYLCTRKDEVPDTPKYEITSQDITEHEAYFEISTPKVYPNSKQMLIAREIKYEWAQQGKKMVCSFNYRGHRYSNAMYLPRCGDCEKVPDADGDGITFQEIKWHNF
jgi:hypothetical protein